MITLTKDQINSLTNVIYDQVKEAARKKVLEAKKASMNAPEFQEIFTEYKNLSEKNKKLKKEIEQLNKDYKTFCNKSNLPTGYYAQFEELTKITLFNRYCDSKELEFPKVNKENIKDEIVIKTIEADNIDSIIESIKLKYLQNA